jgi:hypothetical protein
MWGLLEAIIEAICRALFGEVRKEVEKPKTIEDANTPKNLKADVDADVQRQLDGLRRGTPDGNRP